MAHRLALRALAAAALLLSAVSPGQSQDGKDSKRFAGWHSVESEHYVVHGESGPAIAKHYSMVMELLFREYAKAFQFAGKLDRKAQVYIYRDEGSYQRGTKMGGAVAYYSPGEKHLVSYENPELLQFLAHEATHQFFDLAFPEFYNNKDVPMWFSEGIAECFCNCEIRGRTIYVNVLDNCENAWRNVTAVQDALQSGAVPSLQDMLDMDERTFMQRSGLMYPVSWSFCHFLWNAPELSSGQGKYREVIIRLVKAFREGKKRREAYEESFIVAKKRLDPAVLDAEWRAYIKKLRAKRPPQPPRRGK